MQLLCSRRRCSVSDMKMCSDSVHTPVLKQLLLCYATSDLFTCAPLLPAHTCSGTEASGPPTTLLSHALHADELIHASVLAISHPSMPVSGLRIFCKPLWRAVPMFDMSACLPAAVANAWVGGSIPTALRHMRNLTSITLSNNYYYGTLPSWLGELRQLESISMGTFAGYDEGTGNRSSFVPATNTAAPQ